MATTNPSGTDGKEEKPVCLMCLKADGSLKILVYCLHVFCCKCLTVYLEDQEYGKDCFPCPSCQVEYPLPDFDFNDLQDYRDDLELAEVKKEIPKQESGLKYKKATHCHGCAFAKDVEQDAENLCEECGDLHLCRDCAEIHGKNKATAAHVVISLKNKTEGSCRIHNKLINSYCSSCAQPCCHICVLFDHGDHKIQKIGDVFCGLVNEVDAIAEEQERRSGDLKKCEDQLRFLKASDMTERKDILIRETEEQAEKCIAHIVNQKESLIETIKSDYDVVEAVTDCLDKIPPLAVLDNTVVRARGILQRAEIHPRDIHHLSTVKQDILDYGIKYEVDITKYWEAYKKLFNTPVLFSPKEQAHIDIGELQKEPRHGWDVNKFKSVSQKTLQAVDEAMYIPYVANLGFEFYAIAKPTLKGGVSDGIDVYKVPGELQQTIKERINPLYGMAATAVGHLAVLSDGTMPETCSVHLFCPEKGYIRSTKDLHVVNPLSFDINLRHEYVILSNGEERGRMITIFNEDGSVELTHVIDSAISHVSYASQVVCSGVYVYVSGSNEAFAIFKQEGSDLAQVTTNYGSITSTYKIKDIAVNYFDQIVVICNYDTSCPYLGSYTLTDGSLSAVIQKSVGNSAKGANVESRISIRDDYIVWSQGQTVTVFKA